LIRIKFYPLGTVHAPFDAYGSSKIAKKKKKNQYVDPSPPFFDSEYFLTSLLTNNEGVFPPFFKKDGFFARLPIKKKKKSLNLSN